MIAPPLGLLERHRTVLVRGVQPAKSDPDFSEVERGHVLDDRVTSIYRDRASTLKMSARLVEISDLGVENSQVIEDPRHRLRIARHFERAEAPGIEHGGLSEIASHARQHAAILFDHAEQSRVTSSLGKF